MLVDDDDKLAGILGTILDNPDGTQARLVYADRVEELAYEVDHEAEACEAHAYLIRRMVACSLVACDECRHARNVLRQRTWARLHTSKERVRDCKCGAPAILRECHALSLRPVPCFVHSPGSSNHRPHTPSLSAVELVPGGYVVTTHLRQWIARKLPPVEYKAIEIGRGFVEAVTMGKVAFVRHAETIFRNYPVVHVRLHDAEPDCRTVPVEGHGFPFDVASNRTMPIYTHGFASVGDGESFTLMGDEADHYIVPEAIPAALYKHVVKCNDFEGKHTPADRRLQLMRGCFRFGRERAGLPYLSPFEYVTRAG